MPQYDNNMSGVLFKHDKQGNEKAPDYKGNCEINGVEMWISAWIRAKKSDPSQKFMSLSFELKDGQSFQSGSTQVQSDVPIDTGDFGGGPAAGDDDIPF